jgi:D-sedoheptulose 7-phosphate isomerase
MTHGPDIQTILTSNQKMIVALLNSPQFSKTLHLMANHCVKAFRDGNRLYIMGNGGSASDAEHMAGELVGQFMKKGRKAFPAFSLTQNSATLTALANDIGYDHVFEHQIEGLVQPKDIVLGISTSGNSPNIIRGAKMAREKKAIVLGLTGKAEGELASVCDLCLCIPEANTQRIQEAHGLCIHILCELIEFSAL